MFFNKPKPRPAVITRLLPNEVPVPAPTSPTPVGAGLPKGWSVELTYRAGDRGDGSLWTERPTCRITDVSQRRQGGGYESTLYIDPEQWEACKVAVDRVMAFIRTLPSKV